MDFGFSPLAAELLLSRLSAGAVARIGRDETLATELGIGTVQLDALGAWLRLAGLTYRDEAGLGLSAFGRTVARFDPHLSEPATWWAIHWGLASSYVVWSCLAALEYASISADEVESALRALASDVSERTVRNARVSLFSALDQTPLGQRLGLFELVRDNRRILAINKLRVRHGTAPMAAIAYALLDWARQEETTAAGIERLAGPGGPGPILHLSEGDLERYLMDIDASFGGRVLKYARTASLDTAYFKEEVTPLQVLAAHYMQAQQRLGWSEALECAQQEVPADDAA
jgi:hypothetical protein